MWISAVCASWRPVTGPGTRAPSSTLRARVTFRKTKKGALLAVSSSSGAFLPLADSSNRVNVTLGVLGEPAHGCPAGREG